MKTLTILALAFALSTGAVLAGGSRNNPSDLSDYRTTATAIRAKISPVLNAPAAESGYLGIEVSANKRGQLIVDAVEPDSPAARANVQGGDVLFKLAGKPVSAPDEVRDAIQQNPPGTKITLSVERNRKPVELTASLNAASRPMKLDPDMSPFGADFSEAENGQGSIVEEVNLNSPAGNAGLEVGDVVLKIDGETVTGSGAALALLDQKKSGDTVSLSVFRSGATVELRTRLRATSSGTGRSGRLWRAPVYRVAVVPIDFSDIQHDRRSAMKDWTDFFFSTNTYHGQGPQGQQTYGSVRDYFDQASAGYFHVTGQVFDWVQVARRRSDYNETTAAGSFRPAPALLAEVLDKLLNREGDGVLRSFNGLIFVYAGRQAPGNNRGSVFWPHTGGMNYDGREWNVSIAPELNRLEAADISIYCHEFGHLLGLPDLYVRPENPGSEGLGLWDLMSQQINGGRPQQPSAWSKEQLGWLNPVVLDPAVKQKLILGPAEGSTNECFKVLARADGSEYFLLENRRKKGFDTRLPAEGLLIWRVVGNRPYLVAAHGITGAAASRVFQPSVPYPNAANNSFTPFTTPSSRSELGGGLPVYITNIRQLSDGRITFQIGYTFE